MTAWNSGKPGTVGRPANFARMPDEIRKIEAQLADMGLSWAYADAIAKRMFGIRRVAWCRKQKQLVAILAALHVEQEKRQLGAAVDLMLQRLGWTAADLPACLPAATKNWRRNVAVLRQVHDALAANLPADAGAALLASGIAE